MKIRFSSLLPAVLTALLNAVAVMAVSDESGNVQITADLFLQPGNFSDVNYQAGTGPRLWSNRTAIPYYISSDFDLSEKQMILKTLRIMEKKTEGCILFNERSAEPDYIYFAANHQGPYATQASVEEAGCNTSIWATPDLLPHHHVWTREVSSMKSSILWAFITSNSVLIVTIMSTSAAPTLNRTSWM
ncbi:uncharacterized protein LOC129589681 [Paramacrobiotus metropolitanus]|uniref:uncharacterized protein LOC129589681 n=1 Tax=Paramacrobiotus metropolitanus TaxID=2943436 RepID=UPI0024463C55|nr:uncharacterized protein LOC129589681 [Paramacrobiotus metropolitanus]